VSLWQDIERLESEGWYEDVELGIRDYLVVKGMQRWGASLFGVNFLLGHAFALANPSTMTFQGFIEAFAGYHLAGVLIALILWCRNLWKYGRERAPA